MGRMEASQESVRQLRLFKLENPLSARLGDEFFRGLPTKPGVYFFFGEGDELLYIGQSLNLRARVGSYRYVTLEKHSRRTLRLVNRTERIEHRVCASAQEAINLEAALLLEYRPPFNRAGVWKGEPWWLVVGMEEDRIRLDLVREAVAGAVGPLPSGFRYVLASLVRCLFRSAHLSLPLAHYPHGMFGSTLPRPFRVVVPDGERLIATIRSYAEGKTEAWVAALAEFPTSDVAAEQEYWEEEVERVVKFAGKMEAQSLLGRD